MTAAHRPTPLRRLWGAAAREDGNITVDFVLIFPMFVMMLLMSFEAGMVMSRQVMLERALDIAVRDLRLGVDPTPTHDEVRQDVCNLATLMPSCLADLKLEMRPVNRNTWNVLAPTLDCIDRDEVLEPNKTFQPGAVNQLMLIRACAVFDPFFPTTRWGLRLPRDSSGGYQLAAMSGFVNEP